MFLVLRITPKSRAKICAQWMMSLSPHGSLLLTEYRSDDIGRYEIRDILETDQGVNTSVPEIDRRVEHIFLEDFVIKYFYEHSSSSVD